MFGQTTKLSLAALTTAALVGSTQAGLVAHWTFDDGSGTVADDSAAGDNDLTQTITAGSWTTGKAGGAYNDARFTADDATDFHFGNGSYSISTWINPDAAQNTFAMIAGIDAWSSGNDGYSLKTNSSDQLVWFLNGSGDVSITTTTTLSAYQAAISGGWVHIVGVFDADTDTSTLYVNGISVGSATADNDTRTIGAYDFTVGRYYNSTSGQFNGSIDDVQVYDDALSLADVQFLNANAGTAIPEPGSLALLGLGGLLIARRRRG